jgi:hypothetical protein
MTGHVRWNSEHGDMRVSRRSWSAGRERPSVRQAMSMNHSCAERSVLLGILAVLSVRCLEPGGRSLVFPVLHRAGCPGNRFPGQPDCHAVR